VISNANVWQYNNKCTNYNTLKCLFIKSIKRVYKELSLKLFKPSATEIVLIIFETKFYCRINFSITIVILLDDKYNIMVKYNFST